jgi:hypothetical protein
MSASSWHRGVRPASIAHRRATTFRLVPDRQEADAAKELAGDAANIFSTSLLFLAR